MCRGMGPKLIIIALNILFALAGLALLGIGIWMKADRMFSHYLRVVNIAVTNPMLDWAAIIFIVVGALAFILAFFGCCGALQESQPMLFIYIFIITLLIMAEIIAAGLAVIYRAKVEQQLKISMREQIYKNYGTNGSESITTAWDYIQKKLRCCGAINYTDYRFSNWYNMTQLITDNEVPPSCCKGNTISSNVTDETPCQEDARSSARNSDALNTKGCDMALIDWFHQHNAIMIGLGFGIAFVQILALLTACCLRRNMKRNYPN